MQSSLNPANVVPHCAQDRYAATPSDTSETPTRFMKITLGKPFNINTAMYKAGSETVEKNLNTTVLCLLGRTKESIIELTSKGAELSVQ